MQLSHHRSLTLRTTERSRHEQGYVLVMFALLLVPLDSLYADDIVAKSPTSCLWSSMT